MPMTNSRSSSGTLASTAFSLHRRVPRPHVRQPPHLVQHVRVKWIHGNILAHLWSNAPIFAARRLLFDLLPRQLAEPVSVFELPELSHNPAPSLPHRVCRATPPLDPQTPPSAAPLHHSDSTTGVTLAPTAHQPWSRPAKFLQLTTPT